MKGGDGCEEVITKRCSGKGGSILAERQGRPCQVDNEEVSQVKELKGVNPNVAGLQHEQHQADRTRPVCLIS